jgi:hypothetical protein
MRGLRIASAVALVLAIAWTAVPSAATDTLPILWKAGGLSAGTFSAGQAARITADTNGNVAILSGPADASQLRVTSYTSAGQLRWVTSVTPSTGVFQGDWIAAAPNGDFVAVGHNVTSRGSPIAITLIRLGADGTLLWRVDLARILPNVGRLLVDAQGNAYLAFNSALDGQDIQVQKYGPSGTLLWSSLYSPGGGGAEVASSMALSPDGAEVVVTGSALGGASWITASFDANTGATRWVNSAPVGIAARDVVMDATRVFVTGLGNIGIDSYLTVVAYARSSGAQLWRTDTRPATNFSNAAGLRIALAPDGSLVVAGRAGLFLDWYTVAFEATGAVRWAARRDARSDLDEVPVGVFVMPDGTAVVTGPGGPALPGGFIQGVTAGYGPDGTPLWEGFSLLATVWAVPLPNGTVCATGGYDALVTCWAPNGAPPPPPTFDLTVARAGNGSGRVRSGDNLINCGPDCSETYANGATVTLTARATRSTFMGWSGACTGTAPTCTLTMSSAKAVTATFTRG